MVEQKNEKDKKVVDCSGSQTNYNSESSIHKANEMEDSHSISKILDGEELESLSMLRRYYKHIFYD